MATEPLQFGFPFALCEDGRVASPAYAKHVAQLVEQILWTRPGERVNRPTFGIGVGRFVFDPLSALQAAGAARIQAELQEHLLGIIQLRGVDLEAVQEGEARLQISISYDLLPWGTRVEQQVLA